MHFGILILKTGRYVFCGMLFVHCVRYCLFICQDEKHQTLTLTVWIGLVRVTHISQLCNIDNIDIIDNIDNVDNIDTIEDMDEIATTDNKHNTGNVYSRDNINSR